MIAIKTDMRKMPEMCASCPLCIAKSDGHGMCSLDSREGIENICDKRPDWCPLVEVKDLSASPKEY